MPCARRRRTWKRRNTVSLYLYDLFILFRNDVVLVFLKHFGITAWIMRCHFSTNWYLLIYFENLFRFSPQAKVWRICNSMCQKKRELGGVTSVLPTTLMLWSIYWIWGTEKGRGTHKFLFPWHRRVRRQDWENRMCPAFHSTKQDSRESRWRETAKADAGYGTGLTLRGWKASGIKDHMVSQST